jgi:hypothetical protein
MKPHELCKEYLENLLKRILRLMMLTHYEVEIKYYKGLDAQMDIDIDHEYLNAEIRFGRKVVMLFLEGNARQITATLVHECTHILTSQLTKSRKGLSKRKFLEIEEATNEHISKIILKGIKCTPLKCTNATIVAP